MSEVRKPSLPKSAEPLPLDDQHAQAVFIGWQWTRSGKIYPLYNVTVEGHPYFGSTVSDKTLRRLNLDIPQTPPPQIPAKNS